ncbi:WXG100 family type VII secretion target [Streptomyces sp. NPDC012794]|uniref:WXG100 family type VII secretion target n=1 Tax=Streptomyces sp. NPDC012794 TaxID=3364850 RepID=UPI0036BF0E09
MATTDFEGYTHEQLLGMIASLDPETVKTRATQLTEAAAAIKEIGESLKRHRVTGWEGEAAHAFQDWVSRAGSATLKLGAYSEAGGKWMTEAAQTMVEVKANTPKYDASAAENLEAARKHHHDPDAQQLARTAHTKLTTDHAQAVQQLTKLAQSYEASTTQMNKAEPPTFPPPPGVFAPNESFHETSDFGRASDTSGSSGTGGSAYASSALGSSASSAATDPLAGRRPSFDSAIPLGAGSSISPPSVAPDWNVDVDLDHVATPPDRTPPSTSGLPAGPGPDGPGVNPPHGALPSLALPPISGPPMLGGDPLPLTRPPAASNGKAGGIPVPPLHDTGVVGGRPVPIGGPSAGIPRGTVIGADGPHTGGRVVPGMMGGGFGSPQGTSSGPVTGRRLAIEPGGVVGGRQVAPGGQPFTQAGTGLARGSGVGVVGPGGGPSQAPSYRRGGQGGNRLLAEDEETWEGNRRVVPPVID